jgi:hypothetical protein
MSADSQKQSEPTMRTVPTNSKYVDTHQKVLPTEFGSVYAEKVMIGVDEVTGTVTMTFLQRNLHPQITPSGWQISEVNWKVIAEVKIPINEMNAITLYYIAVMTGGLDILPTINQYLKLHPKPVQKKSIVSYGPDRLEIREDQQ